MTDIENTEKRNEKKATSPDGASSSAFSLKGDAAPKKLTKKEQYKVLRFLGDGSYATVYEAIHLVTGLSLSPSLSVICTH